MSKVNRKNYGSYKVYQTGRRNKPVYEVTGKDGKVVQKFSDLNQAREFNKSNQSKVSSKNKIATTQYKLPVSYYDPEFLKTIGYDGLPDTANIVYDNAEHLNSQLGVYTKWKSSKDKGPKASVINSISASRKNFNKKLSEIENVGDDRYESDINFTAHFNKKIREMELEFNKLIALDPDLEEELTDELEYAKKIAKYHKDTIKEHGKGYWERMFFRAIDSDKNVKPIK
jgi:hypothetical protein